MTEYSDVACSEVHGSIKEDINEDSTTVSVQLHCAWSLRHALCADILTNRRPYPGLTSWENPPKGISASIAGLPSAAGTSAGGQILVYDVAVVTVNYSTKFMDAFTEELEPTSEFAVLDHKRFRWTSKTGDPLLEAEAPGRLIRSMVLSRTNFNVIPPLPTVLRDGVGMVNDAAYDSVPLGMTFEIGELLLGQPKISANTRSDGTSSYQVSMKLAYRKHGWNKYWRGKTETHEEIFDVESDEPYKSYPEVDMTELFV